MNLHELLEARASLWESTKAFLDKVEAEGRADTAEAKAEYDRRNADLSDLDAQIRDAADLDKRNARAEELRSQYAPKPEAPKAQPSDADVLKRMAAGDLKGHEFRDLTTSTGDTPKAGNTVPTSFYGRLQEHMIETSEFYRYATILATDSGETIEIPKTTSHASASWLTEGGSVTESDPVFAQVTLGAHKYGLSEQLTSELEQDTGVNLLEYLARRGGEALANLAAAAYINGDGSGKPTGLVGASTVGVTGAAAVAGVFTADELIDLFYSVISPYRKRGTFVMSDSALKVARKLKDQNDQYLWAPGLVAGEPDTILGRPVLNETNMPDVAADAVSVLFGDLSKYMIRQVRGIRVERSADYAFGNDLVTWRFLARTDGKLIDTTGAVKNFTGGAAA